MMSLIRLPYRQTAFLRSNLFRAGILVTFMCLTSIVQAEVKLELEETEITGARELPKVLYIVPWKKTRPGDHHLPMRSLIDEVISPIDVDVFKRQVRYHELTQPPPVTNPE